MQCSKETITRLFYNVSSSFTLLFFFFYFTSIFLSNFFCFLGGNLFFPRNQDEYEFGEFSDEETLEEAVLEEEEEEEENENYNNNYNYNVAKSSTQPKDNHLVADILDQGERLMFLRTESSDLEDGGVGSDSYDSDQRMSVYSSPALDSIHNSDDDDVEEEQEQEEILSRDNNIETNPNDHQSTDLDAICEEKHEAIINNNLGSRRHIDREKYIDFAPSINNNNNNNKAESKKLIQPQRRVDYHEEKEEDIFGDSCTVGSTSKSSSEWRSSIRDSGTDDPFSSSSRRSCPKWESYTVFQKYDEEMLFLDRISAQKLHETESLRSIQSCPRSISDRIVYKLAAKNKNSSDFRHNNPYHELEGAYVAQICWAWEALNYNYKYFQRLRSAANADHGCPAHIAQKFQQFLVLLQRYVENEPYEHGRRPEIYARMRSLAPKLLQVPEYRDSEDEKKEESLSTRISSDSFLEIMEGVIKTFMDFLKADKANKCQMISAFFRRNRRGSVDPTLLFLLKKVNKKKKIKVKELRRRSTGGCLRKRKLRAEEEMEILMALIDLKVVSRVLRMNELNDEQLHWCEDKMTKVKVSDGKLQRDSSPLFFPAS